MVISIVLLLEFLPPLCIWYLDLAVVGSFVRVTNKSHNCTVIFD